MRNIIVLLLVVFIASCKKEELNPTQVKEFDIHSTSNGATYSIKVALPDNYNPSTQKYAAVYVLDGKENLNLVTSKCKELSGAYSTSNVLVVAIGYGNDRSVDYTPTKASQGGGGAAGFMQFIQNELIPKMETDYGADTSRKSRVILGHSFGGLFTAYAFANYNQVFGNYLMLSPSLWYDNEILLRMEQDGRNVNSQRNQLVFLGMGELEGDGRMQAPFEAFYQRLNKYYPEIKIRRHIVPGLDHVGSKNPDISEALSFYFQNR